jgi:putative DNA primase/helicase
VSDDVWANIPSGAHEDAERELDAERERRAEARLRIEAKNYVESHEARELGKRLIAEKAAAERGPLSSRVHTMAGVRELEPPKHLIRHVLYTGSVAVVLGDSQVGKSWVTQAWACCAVSGLNWPAMTPSTKGTMGVLYVAAEDGGSIKWRIEHWEAAHGRNLDDAPMHVLAEPISLLDDVCVDEIIEYVKAHQIRLMVADTVSATFGGEEESNPEFSRLVRNCRRIAAAMAAHGGGSVVLVHHFGKDKDKGGRGGSALFNDCDIVWELTGNIDDITMTNKKWKVDEKRRPYKLRLDKTNRDAPHIVEQERSSGSINVSATPDASTVMTLEIERALRELADQNQGYGPSGRTIIGFVREQGSTFKTQRLQEQLAVMIATRRVLTRSGPRNATFHRLPPVQDSLSDSQ